MAALRGRRDDDPATGVFDDVGRERAQCVCSSCEVDIDLRVPVLVRHLEKRLERLDARIREQDVDPTELRFDPSSCLAQRTQISLIEDQADPPPPARHHPPTGLLEIRGRCRRDTGVFLDDRSNVDADDISALLCESVRYRTSDPSRGPGDDCDPVLEHQLRDPALHGGFLHRLAGASPIHSDPVRVRTSFRRYRPAA